MGKNEEGKSSKSDKSSSPAPQEQANVHVYPDWAAMQAYYGARVPIPPYYNSAMASGHPPHPYMWGPPQHMMSPYGTPYTAIYPHGGVYAHPGVPLGSQPQGHGVSLLPAAGTPLSIDTPTKPSGNTDHGLLKKLKGFDGLAMSIGNGNTESTDDGAENRRSQSVGTEYSSDGSDGNTTGEGQSKRKRGQEGTSIGGSDIKIQTQSSLVISGKVEVPAVAPLSVAGKPVGPGLPHGLTSALELRNPSNRNAKSSPSSISQTCASMPTEPWSQNDREIKRERRKQSNRESARRSRLRKQAETEELSHKVDALIAESAGLKSEISQLTEKAEQLRRENAILLSKMNDCKSNNITDDKRSLPISTENLLSRVDNSSSIVRTMDNEGNVYDKNSKPGAKLHQLLDTNRRVDAVAAG